MCGEGELGTWEPYTGAKTELAIKSRLKKERCNGDRWAYAVAHISGMKFDLEIGGYL